MQRCRETVEAIRSTRGPNVPARPDTQIEDRLTEVDYGGWTGKELKVLAKDPLWTTVQRQPSAMQFPEGESLRAAATRATEAIRDLDAAFKDEDVWLAVSHGDIIKAIVSDASGAPLDLFQRIVIDPASISVIKFGGERPAILRLNESAAGIASLFAPRERRHSLIGRLLGREEERRGAQDSPLRCTGSLYCGGDWRAWQARLPPPGHRRWAHLCRDR
jgi:probable phosphomutase (TIGR03848 family)